MIRKLKDGRYRLYSRKKNPKTGKRAAWPRRSATAVTLRQAVCRTQAHLPSRDPIKMARKQNYGFDKRRKEQERKAKKDAKETERRQRRDERSAEVPVDPSPATGTSAETPLPPDEEL